MALIPQHPIKFGIFATRNHKKWAFAAIFSVSAAITLDRFTVIILKNFTDALTTAQTDFSAIWYWVIIYSIFYIVTENVWRLSGFSGMRWFTNLKATAYADLYEYITYHSKNYFNNRFAGSVESKLYNASDGVSHLLEKVLWQFFPTIVGVVLYVFIAANNNPLLGLIIAVWTVIYFSLNIFFSKKIHSRAYKLATATSTMRGVTTDSLSNISLVHESAYLGNEHRHIQSFINKHRAADLSEWWLSEWILFTNGILIFIFSALMISTSVMLLQQHLITIGTVIMVIAIVRDIGSQLFFLGQELKEAAKYYGQVNEGLHEVLAQHDITDSEHAAKTEVAHGEITFQNVYFSYEKSKVYKNFSITIPAGQKVGLIGQSGAGKTTFVSLLLRHFDIQDGSISIDGHDISNITLESLRRAIAVVPQDTSLFHRTIRENIAHSNPTATLDEIKQAAKFALASDFIERLPKGYDTLIGERGVKLSGGQRQRIAIARAFLKDAPILILDEATSSLDSESEHAIQESLSKLMKDRTVIAIAHRLSTLKEMDRIVIVKHGKIIEDGTVNELLHKNNSEFKRVWDHQVKGFIVE